ASRPSWAGAVTYMPRARWCGAHAPRSAPASCARSSSASPHSRPNARPPERGRPPVATAPSARPERPEALEPASVELRLEGLEHHYGGRRALEPLSLLVRGPGTVAVTGANGSGKTTLLRILAGLLTPTGGVHELRAGARAIRPARRFEAVG